MEHPKYWWSPTSCSGTEEHASSMGLQLYGPSVLQTMETCSAQALTGVLRSCHLQNRVSELGYQIWVQSGVSGTEQVFTPCEGMGSLGGHGVSCACTLRRAAQGHTPSPLGNESISPAPSQPPGDGIYRVSSQTGSEQVPDRSRAPMASITTTSHVPDLVTRGYPYTVVLGGHVV